MPAGEEETELAFAGRESAGIDGGQAAGPGFELSQEIACEDLGVRSIEGGGGGWPALFGVAVEVGSGGEGEQEDDHINEGGEEEGEDVPARWGGDEFCKREQEFFLAG